MDNSVKELVEKLIRVAIREGGFFSKEKKPPPFIVGRPKRKEWGDLSTNLPFLLAGQSGERPQKIGNTIASLLSGEDLFSRVEFAPPGFINFFLSDSFLRGSLKKIVQEGKDFTRFSVGESRPIQVEFVSTNPTGPLHVGHGRGAALGDALANNLKKLDYKVQKEYYVNNTGRQIRKLAKSLWTRTKQLEGEDVVLPEDGYRGDYLVDLARILKKKVGDIKGDSEEEKLAFLSRFVVDEILKDIQSDLDSFSIIYDNWFFESELYKDGELFEVISFLQEKNLIYEKDGALWFRTSAVNEGEQDRVVRRKNGTYTYFASDIAYHKNKLKRGFYRVVDIWGADHIGYVPRMKAAAKALGYSDDALKILIYQLVTLKKGGRRISASTRTGEFITFKELLNEVGADVARFFFLSRSADSHLDFDLELAKKQTPENPVFYIQYAHARICSILKKAEERGYSPPHPEEVDLSVLVQPEEKELFSLITLLPDQVRDAADNYEPHHLTVYLQELASTFHNFYTRHRVITDDKKLSSARLFLIQGVRIAISDLLGILGISAPEKM